ncbi:hypothetical protein [uncultured Gelidibacter sp.]|uniref:hypothetical protein n=1 Tax=uncultured Gelidibacter sp. TaxID=259318 RepID=UPI002639106B|nr:hypothetical protein [uncultured Gelidibacter sp.]
METQFKLFRKCLIVVLLFGVFACSQDEEALSNDGVAIEKSKDYLANRSSNVINVFKGPEVQYGSGKARSWICVNSAGFPEEIGIELTSKVFNDLSLLHEGHEMTVVLPLHKKAKELTPFEHLGLNYQPAGHGPVFWEEHFDFHFYTITNEQRLLIPDYDGSNQSIVNAFNYFPDMDKMPTDYFKFPGPGGVYGMMGKHWVPADWQTGYNPFTHVMILGTYAQMNNFIEPMVTVEYLLSGDSFSGDYSQPRKFEEPGNNYPTKYNIFRNEKTGNMYITLSDFVTR